MAGALAAYDRIPGTHRAHAVAQVEAVRHLVDAGRFVDAAERLDALPVDPRRQAELEADLYESALGALSAGPAPAGRLHRRAARRRAGPAPGAEDALRRLARLTPDPAQRAEIVDRANAVRPRTIL